MVALDNVQFRLKRGTVHALMGENGAGKSTLMKILAGIYTPDRGDVQPARASTSSSTSPLDALENGIAMIHQELNLMPFMTVAENIWIRREPKNRFGFVDHGEMHRKTARAVQAAEHRTSIPRSRCASCRSPTARWSRSPRRCPTNPTS